MLSFSLAQLQTRVYSIDEVVPPYMYVFVVAFVVSFLLTPLMRIVARYYGIIDRPDNVRKMHSAPVAYLGGVAVFMGWLIFGQMPEIWTFVGAAIVIGSALYIAQREAQLARERRLAALRATPPAPLVP